MTPIPFFKQLTEKKTVRELAPMSGVTDFPFRRIVRKLNSDVVLYSEFTHVAKVKRCLGDRLYFEEIDRPFVMQVFGNDPNDFAEALPLIEDSGVTGLDINMGCPKKKLANSMHGSGLMKEPELACRIIEACVKNTRIPVSVKTRIGWDNAEGLIPFCKKLENAGVSQITIHGRTYRQKFKGNADWTPIYELKKEMRIPVIGNGDVRDDEDGGKKLGNLDGYMLGRASIGNPWAFWRQSENGQSPTLGKRAEIVKEHFLLCLEMFPARRAMTEFRKHLKNYLVPVPNGVKQFRKLLEATDPEAFLKMLDRLPFT